MTGKQQSKDDVMYAVCQHLALVHARLILLAAGDDSALRTWHEVCGSVVVEVPGVPMSDGRWLTLLGQELGVLRFREMMGAALVTHALAARYAASTNRPIEDVLSEVEEHLTSSLGFSSYS